MILSAHYAETEAALAADPILIQMAATLRDVPKSQLIHEDGTPRFNFMTQALDAYKSRGGMIDTHIGGPARALLAILKIEAASCWCESSDQECASPVCQNR